MVGEKPRRSFSSWAWEKSFAVRSRVKPVADESAEAFQRFLDHAQRLSDWPYRDPSRWVSGEVREREVAGMQTFVWNERGEVTAGQDAAAQQAIVYLHGGAYVHQPDKFHFQAVDAMATALGAKVILPIYPKAPRYGVHDAVEAVGQLYREVAARHDDVVLMGDSSGGGLALATALWARDNGVGQPRDIVLLSPWLDVRTDNPRIAEVEHLDPMLGARLLTMIGRVWAGGDDAMDHPYASPIKGDLHGLGRLSVFIGTHDIFIADCDALHQLLDEQGIEHTYDVAENMTHVYQVYPMPEARRAQDRIVDILRR